MDWGAVIAYSVIVAGQSDDGWSLTSSVGHSPPQDQSTVCSSQMRNEKVAVVSQVYYCISSLHEHYHSQ